MSDFERKNGEDLSVEELVSKLKNNINSDDVPSAQDAKKKQESMKKNHDEGGDIASMLKRFLPEEGEDEFELEELAEDSADDEFELESEDVEIEPIASSDVYEQLELDTELDDVDNVETDLADDEFEFTEEDPSFDDGDSEFEFGAPDIDDIPEQTLGTNSLLAGFASVLEETYSPEESQLIAAAVLEANGIDAQTGEPMSAVEKTAGEIDFAEEDLDELPEFEGLVKENLSDFEEITPPDVTAFEAEEPVIADEPAVGTDVAADMFDLPDEELLIALEEDEAALLEPEAPASQLYTFDTPVVPAPVEEYYADDESKNPFAFDTDDEGPVVPDESAFDGVDNAEDLEARMMVENKFSELSEDELNLMVALGYENQIADEDSIKKADEIAEKNNSEIVDPIDVDNSFAFDGVELSSSDQFRAVRNRYKQEHKVMKFRLWGTLIITLALLFFETFTALADAGVVAPLGGALNINRYPVVNIMISLQLVVLACALSWHRLLVGLRDAVIFRPSPISVTSVAILCSVIYDIIMAIIAPGLGLRTYNLTAAVFLLALVVSDYLNLSREIRAFNTL